MSTCNAPDPSTLPFNKEIVTLEVKDKFKELAGAVKEDGSLLLYMKDTIDTIFTDYEISEEEKGKLVANTVGQIVIGSNQTAMQLAVQWAGMEEEQAYTLAKLKADALISQMNLYKVYNESCLVNANIDLTQAQTDKTMADLIRENGKITSRDANGFVSGLDDSGLKLAQTEQTEANEYAALADAYRKSGIVDIAITADGFRKGTGGTADGVNYWQMKVTERQEKGFDDNMRQHAANSASQMISFQLSGDAAEAIQAEDVTRWRNAVDYLLGL